MPSMQKICEHIYTEVSAKKKNIYTEVCTQQVFLIYERFYYTQTKYTKSINIDGQNLCTLSVYRNFS